MEGWLGGETATVKVPHLARITWTGEAVWRSPDAISLTIDWWSPRRCISPLNFFKSYGPEMPTQRFNLEGLIESSIPRKEGGGERERERKREKREREEEGSSRCII
jgi:hypothetical protein